MSTYFRQDFVRTPDGCSLYLRVQGEGEPAIVLNDGLGCDGFAWKYLFPYLVRRHRVVHWHYRGHGRSSMPPSREQIGMEHTCADLERMMDAAGVERAIHFGHSMGVQVALEFQRRRPSRVSGLVLVCGSYGNPLDTFHDHTLLRRAFPRILETIERYASLSRRVTSFLMKTELPIQVALRTELNRQLLKRDDLVPYFAHLAVMDPLAFVRTLDSLKDHSAWDHLPKIDVPTLVVGGEIDRFTPVWLSRRMAEAIPTAEFVSVPGGSHTAPLEQPALIEQRLDRFLRAHFGEPASRERPLASALG